MPGIAIVVAAILVGGAVYAMKKFRK